MTFDKEILKNPVLSLPLFYEEGNCEDAIYDRITDFHNCLSHTDFFDFIQLDNILYFRNHLKCMFEEYYLGHQNNAFNEFQNALTRILRDAPIIKTIVPKEPFYRARTNDSNKDYEDDEMFHIKYSERSKVKTQRFSFPGLPCLYLGASAYVCWMELNRPAFDQFQIALIKQNDVDSNKQILDLSIHPSTFYLELSLREKGIQTEHEDLTLEHYLQYWPIIAACSVAVKSENHSFKPEYIFPQYFLQMILEKKNADFLNIDGIKYMSIKAGNISMKQYESDYRTYTNYVFPIKSSEPTKEGFCKELSSSFKIINNYSGKELQVISDMIREKGIQFVEIEHGKETSEIDDTLIFGSNDKGYQYKNSIFGRIESILNNRSCEISR